MNIAEQLKAFHTVMVKGHCMVDTAALIEEAEKIGEVTQDWDNGSTQIDFVDGSCIVVCESEVFVYGSQH